VRFTKNDSLPPEQHAETHREFDDITIRMMRMRMYANTKAAEIAAAVLFPDLLARDTCVLECGTRSEVAEAFTVGWVFAGCGDTSSSRTQLAIRDSSAGTGSGGRGSAGDPVTGFVAVFVNLLPGGGTETVRG
jgi:hypothetical protein